MQKAKAKSKASLARANRAHKAKGKAHVPLHRHVKRILGMTPKFVHGMVVGAFVGVLLVSVLRSGADAHALSMNVSRDCTANAVIHCGALSTSELVDRYSGSGVATMYAYFGISASEIKNIGTTAVAGTAYKDGTIRINSTGKVVATGALSMGRENIAGSTKIVKDGFTFYVRTPKVAFIPNSLAVYVSMVKDQFQFAIIPGCGNPLEATAVVQPKPKPTPTPAPTPTPTPKPPHVETIPTAPPSTSTPVTTASVVTTLPNTGPGAVVIIAILSVIGGYVFHATHRHIRNKRTRGTHHTTHPHAA